jgi:hypothetical protein
MMLPPRKGEKLTMPKIEWRDRGLFLFSFWNTAVAYRVGDSNEKAATTKALFLRPELRHIMAANPQTAKLAARFNRLSVVLWIVVLLPSMLLGDIVGHSVARGKPPWYFNETTIPVIIVGILLLFGLCQLLTNDRYKLLKAMLQIYNESQDPPTAQVERASPDSARSSAN